MPCYHPITAYKSRDLNPTGKRSLVFRREDALPLSEVEIPCGQCIGCRLERTRQWAVRIMHEASLHDANSFITLTYAPEHLPETGTLVKKHFQDFMKRFRRRISPVRVKFYMCGEYGDKKMRPHYHAIIFGYDFPDKELFKKNHGSSYYYSPMLEKTWGRGFCVIGDVSFESASYVARYCMKKITGKEAERVRASGTRAYEVVDPETGEIHEILPEYSTMSRGGRNGKGLAFGWIEKYLDDTYKDDFVVLRGQVQSVPKYYDSVLEVENAALLESLKKARKRNARERTEDNTYERLAVKEKVKKSSINKLKRNIEDI